MVRRTLVITRLIAAPCVRKDGALRLHLFYSGLKSRSYGEFRMLAVLLVPKQATFHCQETAAWSNSTCNVERPGSIDNYQSRS
jgi:hypothetical protein